MKIKSFITNAVFATGLAGLSWMAANVLLFDKARDQALLYDQGITQHVDRIRELLSVGNETKEKYGQYITQDMDFFASLVPNEARYRGLFELDILIKEHTWVDKLFYPAVHVEMTREKEKGASPQALAHLEQKYKGYGIYYHAPLDKTQRGHLMMGINALEDKQGFFNEARKVWGGNHQVLTSFILYHELGHHVGVKLLNEDKRIDVLLSDLERLYGLELSQKEIDDLTTQYKETFSDKFAMQMTKKRYPEIDIDEKSRAWSRFRNKRASQDFTHISTVGLNLQHSNATHLEGMIDTASNAALINLGTFMAGMPERVIHDGQESWQKVSEKTSRQRMKALGEFIDERHIDARLPEVPAAGFQPSLRK